MNINYLKWDSEFFKIKIGIIYFDPPNINNLAISLNNARQNGFQLIYLFAPEEVFLDKFILNIFNGKLIDRKVDFKLIFQNAKNNITNIEEYLCEDLTEDLEKLAYQSGSFSRFNIDEYFSSDDFHRLYYNWILKSVRKELANKIFIIKEFDKTVGMVTIKRDYSIGEIGLIAVSDSSRGKGYGEQLIESCKISLIEENINILKVKTQIANLKACKFYEKCGFEKTLVTNIYHFWLLR